MPPRPRSSNSPKSTQKTKEEIRKNWVIASRKYRAKKKQELEDLLDEFQLVQQKLEQNNAEFIRLTQALENCQKRVLDCQDDLAAYRTHGTSFANL